MPLNVGAKLPLEAVRRLCVRLLLMVTSASVSTVNKRAAELHSRIVTRFALLSSNSLPLIVPLSNTRAGRRGRPAASKGLAVEYRDVGNPPRSSLDELKEIIVSFLSNQATRLGGQWGEQQRNVVEAAVDAMIASLPSGAPAIPPARFYPFLFFPGGHRFLYAAITRKGQRRGWLSLLPPSHAAGKAG